MDTVIHWFRQDLRLKDNPSLSYAAKGKKILPIYILDEKNSCDYKMGEASKWWLHYSLKSLNESLHGNLMFYKGDPEEILTGIIKRKNIKGIYWNRCYEPWRTERDKKIKEKFLNCDVEVKSFNGSLLWEPWNIKKEDGSPYKVFTPFYKKGCLNYEYPRKPMDAPSNVEYISDSEESINIKDLDLLPYVNWGKKLETHWEIGESGAISRVQEFIKEGVENYKEGRNIPSKPYVSRISPYLHFGEISPNQLWHKIRSVGDDKNIEHFCSELGWREFSYSQLYYNPTLPNENLQKKFDNFPWSNDSSSLEAWQKGKTGIPMVDAGMRELWKTGYMHNRVRMIVGSFLVKNLRLHWHNGERWFWNTLVDADLANNSASWQWIAGCGADAAPYFRVFNPVTQGQKFDPDGDYVRKFIPEIASLPNKYLFSPWEAPENLLKDSSVILGDTYPKPIVDLKLSREKALESFKSLKS